MPEAVKLPALYLIIYKQTQKNNEHKDKDKNLQESHKNIAQKGGFMIDL